MHIRTQCRCLLVVSYCVTLHDQMKGMHSVQYSSTHGLVLSTAYMHGSVHYARNYMT